MGPSELSVGRGESLASSNVSESVPSPILPVKPRSPRSASVASSDKHSVASEEDASPRLVREDNPEPSPEKVVSKVTETVVIKKVETKKVVEVTKKKEEEKQKTVISAWSDSEDNNTSTFDQSLTRIGESLLQTPIAPPAESKRLKLNKMSVAKEEEENFHVFLGCARFETWPMTNE